MPELENKLAAPEGCAPLSCSALNAALALVDFGPCRGADRPQDWINVAAPMCKYCRECEDVNLAAARIIADYVTELESVCDSEQLARAQSALANVEVRRLVVALPNLSQTPKKNDNPTA